MAQPAGLPKGKSVGFKPLLEDWTYYSLDDGLIVGIKLVATKILKTEQIDPEGNPIYVVFSSNVLKVMKPDEYKSIVKGV